MDRKLVAILAADVAGYSRLMGADEERTLDALRSHREVVDGLIAAHRGRVFNSAGDSVVAEFPSAVEAINCAVEIQQEMEERNKPVAKDKRLQFRIGLNIGDVMAEGGNLFGDGVNVAARMQELAEPGGICAARNVYNQVRHKVGAAFESLGEHRVKNIAEPVAVYRVLLGSIAARPPILVWLARLHRQRLAVGALALVLLIAAGAVAWNFYPREPATVLPLPDTPSIAVLPFKNLSGDPGQEYFVDGVTESLITALSRFPDLFVIASTSTFAYKDKPTNAQQVGQKLGIRYVLEGSIQKVADRVRITAQLIDAPNDRQVWADSYERHLDDILAIQGDVIGRIASTLSGTTGRIATAELERAKRQGTGNWRAYDYVLLGQEFLNRFTKEDNAKARESYKAAIALDPNYAQAYVGLAWTYLLGREYQFDPSPEEALGRAFEIAKKAVALDESDADTRWTLGYAFLYRRQHDWALAEYQRGLELNPNYADLMADMVFLLAYMGRAEEGLAFIERAKRLNPFYPDWYLWNFALAYYTLHRYADAVANLKSGDLPVRYRLYLAASYAQLGRLEEARTQVREILKLDPAATLESWGHAEPFENQTDLEHFIDGLRKAGLPE